MAKVGFEPILPDRSTSDNAPVGSVRRSIVVAPVLALAVGWLAGAGGVVVAQDVGAPEDGQQEVDPRFDEPFGSPQYLIHLTGTFTMNGFVEKDSYLLYHTPPDGEGQFLTADGSGGTFNNTGELIGGPFATPREVCAAASGLPTSTFSAWNSNYAFDCATAVATGSGGGVNPLLIGLGLAAAGALGAGAVAAARHRGRRAPAAASAPAYGTKLGLITPSVVSPAPRTRPRRPRRYTSSQCELLTRMIHSKRRRLRRSEQRLRDARLAREQAERDLASYRDETHSWQRWNSGAGAVINAGLGMLVVYGLGAAVIRAGVACAGQAVTSFYTARAAGVTMSATEFWASLQGAQKIVAVGEAMQGTAAAIPAATTGGFGGSVLTNLGWGYVQNLIHERIGAGLAELERSIAGLRQSEAMLEASVMSLRADAEKLRRARKRRCGR